MFSAVQCSRLLCLNYTFSGKNIWQQNIIYVLVVMHSQRWILCFIVQSKVSNPLLVSKGRGGLGKIPRAFSPQGRRVLTGLGRGPGSCILGIVLFV